jgi:predicted dehydrogenase
MMDNYEPESVMGSVYRKLADTENAANAWGPWDPKKFTVEDSAFGMIKMKNGATIWLESSWALNTLQVDEAKTILCGTKAGADMMGNKGALRINGERYSNTYTQEIDLGGGGVAFYDGDSASAADVEARMWIDHVLDDKKPLLTKPEQAIVVTQLLEAIYESAKTGKVVTF